METISKTALDDTREDDTDRLLTDIVDSVTDFKYSNDGRFVLSRDFLTLKLWDVAMEREPLRTFHIHDYLRPRLCELYENECIFDRFECAISHDNTSVFSSHKARPDTSNNTSTKPTKKTVR